MIQELWRRFKVEDPSPYQRLRVQCRANITVAKIARAAFYAGAEMMRDELNGSDHPPVIDDRQLQLLPGGKE